MSSEIDHPRQRTVAELLAEHGGGDAATGRRRRRREAELAAGDDVPAGAGGDPPGEPDRSTLRRPVPHEADRAAPPQRPAPGPFAGFDADVTEGGLRRNGPAPEFGARPPGRLEADLGGRARARRDGAPEGAAPNGSGRGAAPRDDPFGGPSEETFNGHRGPRRNGSAAATGAFGAPTGQPPPWRGAPAADPSSSGGFRRNGDPSSSGGFRRNGDPSGSGGFRRNGDPSGSGGFRPAGDPSGTGGFRPSGPSGATGTFRLEPGRGGAPRRRAEPDGSLFDAPGRAEPPPVSGPQTQVVAPVGPERATEQMPRMRRDGTAMIDPLLTAPIAQQDDGPPTSADLAPARPGRRRDRTEVDDERPPDLEDDHPAGLDVEGMRSPSPRRSERPAASSGQAWAAVVAQWIVGAIGGAALWVGFRFLWQYLPVVAIAAAALVTVGLVLVVRHLLRNDDRRTTLFAVLVGLLLTVSPALLVLLHRT